jgi:hypothetical protein
MPGKLLTDGSWPGGALSARNVAQDLPWRGKRRGYPAGDHSLSAAARARNTIGRHEERSAMNEEPTHKQSMPGPASIAARSNGSVHRVAGDPRLAERNSETVKYFG